MAASDQGEVIAFLADPASHGPGVGRVERIDTHGAVVFLAGEHAYKLKRAVRFPYMDFSTLEKRRAACEAEIRLNRRTAPMIYERAAPIVRTAAGLRIGGAGEAVDWIVVMRRFDRELLFDRLVARGDLGLELIRRTAAMIAAFHAAAETRPEFGGRRGMAAVVDGNRAGLLAAAPGTFAADAIETFDRGCREWLAKLGPLLERRRRDGRVRQCHGDLHLRNICLIDGRPVLFDAIEFNDAIACCDTLYDLAFLLVDLELRGLRAHANAALNAYLESDPDHEGVAALPLFLACRAGVKAQTLAASARAQPDAARRGALEDEARHSLRRGLDLLAPGPARIVAIGGLSGTGKTTLAYALAPELEPPPGAVVLRSDVIRKRRAGVAPTTRLDAGAYTEAASQAVYAELAARAQALAAGGHAVVCDAVYARLEERAAIEAAARRAGAPFTGLWLTAPHAHLVERVESRRGDASDATAEVVARQSAYDLGPMAWAQIDAARGAADTLAAARTLI